MRFGEAAGRIRRRLSRVVREVVPGTRIGKSVGIGRLICPLRYDIWIRVRFMQLLRDEPSLYQQRPDEFLRRPQARAYWIWYREVACARFHPSAYPHEHLLQARFRQRVEQTAGLWRSFERQGFDRARPVRLASGRVIEAVNGKRVEATIFAGDGCHRLAALYLSGHHCLEPPQYEVEVHRRYRPLDNTAILCRALPLDVRSYVHFLSRFYCDGVILHDLADLVRKVAAEKPRLLPELESVLAADHVV